MNKSKLKASTFWIGFAIVALTHIYMLIFGLPANQMVPHAVANLIAAALVLYSYYQ